MAKIRIERAYIEAHDEEEDNFSILIHIRQDVEHIFVGKVELDRSKPWIFLQSEENGDLHLNYSAGMAENKWEHITNYIIGEYNG